MCDEGPVPLETTEHRFTCPYCWQAVTVLVDPSVDRQSYIEDCEACCNPIEISYAIEAGKLVAFAASSIEQ